jgi:hypothetical protein
VKKALLGLVACALVVVATANAARDPRLERLALKPADIRLGKLATVQLSDLSPGWQAVRTPAGDDEAPDCPGYRPDFSRFTITGQADSAFESQRGAASIVSRAEVYETKQDASGDFALSTLPPVARCLGILVLRETPSGTNGFAVKVLSSRRVAAPRYGDRSASYRIVTELAQGGRSVKVYLDVAVVLRGRSIGGIFFTGVQQPVADQRRIVTRIATRLR